MLQHDFTKYENKSLMFLRNSFIRSVNNNACAAAFEPLGHALKGAEAEMVKRGIPLTIKAKRSERG